MNRSPYHLTDPERSIQFPQVLHPIHTSEVYRSATPPLQDEGGGEADEPNKSVLPSSSPILINPIVQPHYGSYVSRYGTSRSIGIHQNHVVAAAPPTRTLTHVHPLQPEAREFEDHFRPVQEYPASKLSLAEGLLKKARYRLRNLVDVQREGRRNHRGTGTIKLAIPMALVLLSMMAGLLPSRLFDRTNYWDRLSERHLEGRQCVMNLFVDKHEANEFNPDYDPNGKVVVHIPVEGTYRSKGQIEVMNRFISSVAAAFRPNVGVQQHVVFAGTRDGGHLAQEALRHWPARGSYRTQLHVLAGGQEQERMQFETIQDLEDLFADDHQDVHIYDSAGNTIGDDDYEDDDGLDEELKGRQLKTQVRQHNQELPDLQTVIFEPDEEEDSVIPYLHVDGTTMASQMDILYKATSLLRERKVVVVGLEHSGDLDVQELIDFFRSLNYKTFMLGLRQLTRIDNLCPEILANVMQHPSLESSRGRWFPSVNDEKRVKRPPFFVAMPRGRHSKEEMSIQHMYDLFSGASGLLQVKTANDRVASVK